MNSYFSGIASRSSQVISKVYILSVLLITAASPAVGQLTVTGFNGLSATISSNGAWTVSVAHPAWKFSGNAGASVYASRIASGTDNLGPYQEVAFDYKIGSASRTGSIRVYPSRPVVLFALAYTGSSTNSAPFPVFTSYPAQFHLTYSGEFAEPDFVNISNDSPLVSFDSSANTFVISPASDFMTTSTVRNGDNSLATGISTQIGSIPNGLVHQTALVFGAGIGATLVKWGQAITDLTGKQRPANDADALLKSVSYWTDNGATYYYNPGGPVYSDTLQSIKSEFDAKGIRLGSLQLDSWWYPKGPDNSWSSHSGIWTYTAAPGLFQPDFATFQKNLATPLIAHARWIDSSSPYRTQYSMSGGVATDPRYWDDTATYLDNAGVKTYEQDWLGDNAHSDFNLTDPYAFLGNMAASMAKHGMTIQYCMALPKHFLQSSVYSNVTTIRTSQDHFAKDRWNNFLYSSRFASALGAWPFSDVFMSEEYNNLIAAVLSAGPVGVGDEMGKLSGANLLKAVRSDGIIVKPDVPATPLDGVYVNDAQKIDVPMVAAAATDFGGGLKANYIFAFVRGTNTTISINPATYGITGASYLYDTTAGTGAFIDKNGTFTLDLTGGSGYFILMPIGATGIAFLGDKDHIATLGKKRIPTLTDTGRIDVTVSFAPGEKYRTLFGYSPQPVAATALAGTQEGATWDPTTQLFSLRVRPSTAAATAGTGHFRIVQSFAASSADTSRGGSPIPVVTR